MTSSKFSEITFTDADVVNVSDWIPRNDRYNPHRVRPWLLHDHGVVLAVVFADCEQDAIDEAADAGKLDRYQLTDADAIADYGADGDNPTCAFLGNASEPFNIDTLGIIELPNPPLSFCAAFNALDMKPYARGK